MYFHPSLFAAACLLLCAPSASAAEPPLRELLRDGLYAEEVTRDVETASKNYEQVLARFAEQRAFAASALFRLAEVRRKQDRKDDAIQLYQRLLTEFPDAAAETKLARENLAAIGGKPPEAAKAAINPEAQELARLQGMAERAPDVLLDPDTLLQAAEQGWTSVVKFLLAKGNQPYAGSALSQAADLGNLEIVKLLTDQPTEVPDAVAADAIWAAIDAGRHTILEYLLQKGFKPGKVNSNYGKIPTFIRAVMEGKLRGAEILLKHGADINVMADATPQPNFFSVGTALHLVIQNGTFDTVKWLLEKGAKPDLPDPIYGLSPLHYAVRRGNPGDTAITEILLAAGADPNRRSKDVNLSDELIREYFMNSTPLEVATVFTEMIEHVKLLLKQGADPNLEGSKIGKALAYVMDRDMRRALELLKVYGEAGFPMTDPVLLRAAFQKKDWNMIELLLKYGANPNVHLGPHSSLLASACKDSNAARIALLLKAGADVNEVTGGEELIYLASVNKAAETALPMVKLLLDAGAKPDERWKKDGYRDAPAPIQEILLEKFTIPELGKESEITLLIDTDASRQTLSIATRTADSTIPELGPWLLAHHTAIENFPSDEDAMLHWAIWRKGENGAWAKQEVDLKTSKALPELRWGDVVTCTFETGGQRARQGINRLPVAELWHLRKRISFPITVETDGKSREIQVRGDRLFFDPTRDEVPLADAQNIADYLWQNDLITRNPLVTLIVSRKDWPDIRLSCGSTEAGKFQLEAGDRLKLEVPAQVSEDIAKARRLFVTLKVEAYPFDKLLGWNQEGKPVEASIPTLIQALVDTQTPPSSSWMDFATEKTVDLVKMYGVGALYRFTLLPHPDLSKIRIRRLTENGAEKVIEVNLAKDIAAATDQTTAQAARKADVLLQPGDVVEISLLKGPLDAPWKGFNLQEQAFFAKALGGRVQVTDDQGAITLEDLLYKAPRFMATETGWVPLPPETGMPSLRGSWLTRAHWMKVKRGEVQSGSQPSSKLFLRDRDEIQTSKVEALPMPQVMPPPAQPLPQPRPRVVPPPQN